ncbi:uncharacterized protein LOC100371986 [Saccoglossus kowalevskii]
MTFVEREWGNMKTFLHEISGPSDEGNVVNFDGIIDLGRELSILHSLLTQNVDLCNKDSLDKLEPLPDILSRINSAKEQPMDESNLLAKKMALYSSTPSLQSSVPDHLAKLFQDADLSNSGDVSILPSFDSAMNEGSKSCAVNSLVQFLKKGEHRKDDVELKNCCHPSVHSPEDCVPLRRVNLSCDLFKEQLSEESSNAPSSSETSPSQDTSESSPGCQSHQEMSVAMTTRPQPLPLSFSNPVYQLSVGSLKYIDETTNDSKSSVASNVSFQDKDFDSTLGMSQIDRLFTVGSNSSSTESSPSPEKMPYGIPGIMDAPHTLPKLGSKGGHRIESSLRELERCGQYATTSRSSRIPDQRTQSPVRPVSLMTASPRTRAHHHHGHQTIRTLNTAVKHSLYTTMAQPLHAAVLSDSSSGDSPTTSTAMHFSATSSSNATTPSYSPLGFNSPPAELCRKQETATQTTMDSRTFAEVG